MTEPQITTTAAEASANELAPKLAEGSLEYWRAQRDRQWIFGEPFPYLAARNAEGAPPTIQIARNIEDGRLRVWVDGTEAHGRFQSWVIDAAAALPWRGGHTTPGYERPDSPTVQVVAAQTIPLDPDVPWQTTPGPAFTPKGA